MSDWPVPILEPNVTIHPWSLESIGPTLSSLDYLSSIFYSISSTAWPTANLALFVPFLLTKQITAVSMFTYNGTTVSGNLDIGIYSEDGTRIVSMGSTAQSGIVLQTFDIADTIFGPGIFYLALAFDNITAKIRANTAASLTPKRLSMTGMAQMADAFPLPATAVFATATSLYFVPIIGLTTRSVL